jgi:serine/threonine protein kinase
MATVRPGWLRASASVTVGESISWRFEGGREGCGETTAAVGVSGALLGCKDGRVKIGDLGLAKKLIKRQSTDTEAGTLHYLAPERFHAETTFCADIWAFGATLHFAALGRHPYSHKLSSFIEFELFLDKKDPIPPLPSVEYHDVTHLDGNIHDCFSPELIDFCSQCMVKDPKVRPSAKTLLKHPWITSRDSLTREDNTFHAEWVKFMDTKKFDGATELPAIAATVVQHPVGRDNLSKPVGQSQGQHDQVSSPASAATPGSARASSNWKSLRHKISPRLESSVSMASQAIISSWASIKTLADSLDLTVETVAGAFRQAHVDWLNKQEGTSD